MSASSAGTEKAFTKYDTTASTGAAANVIIDAHNHIFPEVNGLIRGGETRGAGYGRATVGGQRTMQMFPPYNERTEFTPEMLIANLDWAGVDKAVLQQGTYYGECNEYVLRAIERYPDRLLGALHADPWRADYRSEFERMLATGRFHAVKIEFSVKTGLSGIHSGARLDDAAISWLWATTQQQQIPLVLDLGTAGDSSYQTAAVRAIAETHEDLKIVIAHLAQPRKQAEQSDAEKWQLWKDQIALGRLPNVWFDMASLPDWGEDFPYPAAAHFLMLAIAEVGAEKIMWGSDQPGTLHHQNYPAWLRLIHLHTEQLSPDEREMIMGGNAVRVYLPNQGE